MGSSILKVLLRNAFLLSRCRQGTRSGKVPGFIHSTGSWYSLLNCHLLVLLEFNSQHFLHRVKVLLRRRSLLHRTRTLFKK